MKKLNNFWLISLLLFLSCETDDDFETDSEDISTMLVGTWELTEITSEEGRIGSATPTSPNYFEIIFYGEGSDLDLRITFSENPNALEISGEGFLFTRTITEITGNIELNADSFDEQWAFSYDFFAPGRGWKVEEKKYLYDHTQGSLQVHYGAEILELNESILRLKMKYNKDFPKTGDSWGRETNTFYAIFTRI